MNAKLLSMAVIFLLIAAVSTTNAALRIDVGNVLVSPGSVGSIDVHIRSDDFTQGDKLQAFGIRLALDAVAAGFLQLVNPPSNGELVDANYVFAGNSDAIVNGSTASVSTAANTNDTYDGADLTANLSNVTISTTPALLVRLDVRALAGAMPGDYSLRLINANSTFFEDTNQGPKSVSFISNPGTVTVRGTGPVVPEPSSAVLFGTVLCGLVVTSRRIRQVYLDTARTSIRSLGAERKWLA